MSDPENRDLNRRLSKLESDVEDIKTLLRKLAPDHPFPEKQPKPTTAETKPATATPLEQLGLAPAESTAPPKPATPTPPPPPVPTVGTARPRQERSWELPEKMRKWEFWLNKLGIGLILFGVAFAFKYSIDQGWITPPVRHLFGIVVGAALFVVGYRVYGKRQHFAQVLLGGAIGVWYITTFSAFQLFDLVPHGAAFGIMVVISALAFGLALRQDDAIFSLIGTAGALGTPFMLYTGSGSVPGLMMYTCLVLIVTSAVYFYKGWRLLFWLSVIGGWVVMAVGLVGSEVDFRSPLSDRWSLQGGLIFAWLNFWLTPIIRRIVVLRSPERLAPEQPGLRHRAVAQVATRAFDRHLHLLSVSSAILGLLMTGPIWSQSDHHTIAWGVTAAAAFYGLVSWYLRRHKSLKQLAYTQAAVGTLLLTIAFWLWFEGDTLLFIMAGEALVINYIATRLDDNKTEYGGHFLSLIAACWVVDRVLDPLPETTVFFNMTTAIDLWVVATLTVSALIYRPKEVFRFYYLVAAALLAGVLIRELDGNAQLLAVTAEAVVLYFADRRLKDQVTVLVLHLGFLVVAGLLGMRIVNGLFGSPAGVHLDLGIDLIVIAIGLVIAFLQRPGRAFQTYFIISAALLAAVFIRDFEGNTELLLLIAEAVTLHLTARALKDDAILITGHLFFVGLLVPFVQRLGTARMVEPPCFNANALTDLVYILAALGTIRLIEGFIERRAYGLVVHLMVLTWLWRELVPLENGQGYISIAWGVYGAALLIAGLRLGFPAVRLTGLGTLLLLVAKLFLVDLAKLETIWKVLLFVGFGSIFLALSYYFPKLWKGETNASPPRES